jgi:tetraacyldisaccharide 4'-kinase
MKLRRTPSFWYAPRGWQSFLLAPAAMLYGMGRTLHANRKRPQSPALPVICVGNIVAGGTGKTPAARALLALVREEQIARNPCFITRGYGNDESRLLERDAPVIVTHDRLLGADRARKSDADIAIMDDGFQNPDIRATINIVVIDGAVAFGNECLLPAGPLREHLADGFTRADAFIIIGSDRQNIGARLPAEKPVFTATLRPRAGFTAVPGRAYVAFAGLGRPQKFRDTLAECGITVVAFVEFPDHHPYSRADIAKLVALGRAHDADLITTEKDAVRLPRDFTPSVLPVELVFDDRAGLVAFLRRELAR